MSLPIAPKADCIVCRQEYRDIGTPHILQCGHAFCKKCLELITRGRGRLNTPCPTCKKPFDPTEIIPLRVNTDNLDTFSPPIQSPDSGEIQIFLRNLGNRTICIRIDRCDTVRTLKRVIYDKESIPQDQQRLIYGGKQLEDYRLCSSYGIERDSTVQLVARMLGGC